MHLADVLRVTCCSDYEHTQSHHVVDGHRAARTHGRLSRADFVLAARARGATDPVAKRRSCSSCYSRFSSHWNALVPQSSAITAGTVLYDQEPLHTEQNNVPMLCIRHSSRMLQPINNHLTDKRIHKQIVPARHRLHGYTLHLVKVLIATPTNQT